ncbi:MAG: ABC transporter permease [Anaerolineales bacterium]|nr:ABC transporter permease [Anaerolineales bacterium]
MRKIWLIATNVYRTRVRSGTFLFLTFFLPLLMVVAGLIVPLFLFRDEDSVQRMGIIDQTLQLSLPSNIQTEETSLNLIHLADLEQAHNEFQAGHIDAYLVIPSGYFEGETVVFYGEDPPGTTLTMALERLLRASLLPDEPETLLDLIENPSEVIYIEQSTGTEITSPFGLAARMATPAIIAFLFAMAVAFSSGQLGSAIVREKEQRAMEIVITSLRPSQLVAGNVLGMSLLVLTQYSIWILGGIIALMLFASGGAEIGAIMLPWRAILWGILLTLPGFLLFAVLAAGAGVIAGDNQQAQQLASIVGLFAFVPLWFTALLITQPDGSIAIALTLFPLTAPTVALVRMVFSEVPTWQLLASCASLLVSLLLAVWIVARIFRVAMLVYGQPFRPVQIWKALLQS